MDLSQFDTRERAEAGVDVPLVIGGETIMGDDGEPVTFRIRGLADRRVHASVMRANKRPAPSTPEAAAAEDIRLAQVAVIGWSDNFAVNGEKLPFSVENVAVVMDNPRVRRAILMEVMNEENFTTRP